MKNLTMIIIICIAVLGGGYFVLSSDMINGASTDNGSGDVQKITLGLKNYNYYPDTITLKAGTPVELTLDSSIVGCYRSFNIRSLGISEYSKSPSNTIKFTIPEKGTYAFACSMGMGYGKIVVE